MTSPTLRDYAELVLLSAIWGSSFLFLRIASPEFGPVFLIQIRVFSGFIFLLPVCIYFGKHKEALENWKLIFAISLSNMSIPFCLLAFASLSIGAGFTSVLNSTVPFFAAIIAFVVWSQKMTPLSLLGLCIGFLGVVTLVFDPTSATPVASNSLAIVAGLTAAMFYGFAVNLTAYKLSNVSGLSITVGSLFLSSICLSPFAYYAVPEEYPTLGVWLSAISLGVLCTGVAYLMFYRLIKRVGSHRAITSTFMIPVFSILWGALFLDEEITLFMLGGCVLVLFGVALTTGWLRLSKPES